MIISVDTEKEFDKIQYPFRINKQKNPQQIRNRREFPQPNKVNLKNLQFNILLNGERQLKAFLLRSRTK